MPTPLAHYEARLATMKETLAKTARLSFGISLGRVIVFLLGGASGASLLWLRAREGAYAMGASIVAFIVLVVWHAKVSAREDREKAAVTFSELGIARVGDRFDDLPMRGEKQKASNSPLYAHDLDLFGKRSLLAILDSMGTELSEKRLADWLSTPASPDEIHRRQEAAQELAKDPELRERIFVHARASEKEPDLSAFFTWSESHEGDGNQVLPTLLGIMLPAITLSLLFFPSTFGVASYAWLAPGTVQGIIALVVSRRANLGLHTAIGGARSLAGHGRVIGQLAAGRFTSPMLKELGAKFSEGDASARVGLARLERIASFAEARESGMFSALIGPFLLYDLHLLLALRRWRRAYGSHVRAWVSALADLLSLAGIATYSFDHPTHIFPEVEAGPSRFSATGLAHPLIAESKRVANDIAFAGPGTALLVTGSNMSGKSTLLRAVGSAAVMAQAGAPVAAKSLSMSPLAIRTSIRVSDSLAEGVSHFYAELLALRRVVEDAKKEPVLFLLDEILHGTNSRERQVGAKSVIKHVLEDGAMGAVSTHDLGLAELVTELPDRVRPVHFVEQSEDGKMTFDYRLRDGLLTSGNALALMKQLGLPVDDTD